MSKATPTSVACVAPSPTLPFVVLNTSRSSSTTPRELCEKLNTPLAVAPVFPVLPTLGVQTTVTDACADGAAANAAVAMTLTPTNIRKMLTTTLSPEDQEL